MGAHLAEEEEVVPSLLREHFTAQEEEQTVQKILASLGYEGNKLFLPWIIEAYNHRGDDQALQNFTGNLPMPVKMLYSLSWKQAYGRDMSLLTSIISGERPAPAKGTCAFGPLAY